MIRIRAVASEKVSLNRKGDVMDDIIPEKDMEWDAKLYQFGVVLS